MKILFRRFIEINLALSRAFDKLLPAKYTVDGNRFFIEKFVPLYIDDNLVVYDIGGGKNPYFNIDKKKKLNIRLIGLDIDQKELNLAPKDNYDSTICADITQCEGSEDADIVICQALLEHVKDTDKAILAIKTILKPGGVALIFVPSRNALYARLNLLLPESTKRKILYSIYPKTRHSQGFPSYYNQCTPDDFRQICQKYDLNIEKESFHYISSYFSFFFPVYIIWRIWIIVFKNIVGDQAAETFCMALRKKN